MAAVLVCVPVFGRPWRVEPLISSLRASQGEVEVHARFAVSETDTEEMEALRQERADYIMLPGEPGPGDYAIKINTLVGGAEEERFDWFLCGADDLEFRAGWADIATRTGERLGVGVVGTNDGANRFVRRGLHSTHPLVSRAYVETLGCTWDDGPGYVYHPGYDHQFVDNELVQCAIQRREWAFARDSLVLHQHPNWGTAPLDPTYEKGQRCFAEDSRLFSQRVRMYGGRRAKRERV